MTDWKKLYSRILYPPLWVLVILSVLSIAALIAVFLKELDKSPIAYVVYVISFYALVVDSICCVKSLPGYCKSVKNKVYENEFGNRYLTDPVFKTHIKLHRSLIINLLYAGFNLVAGFYYSTAWFILFAVYYCIMAVIRFLLVRYVRREEIGNNRYKELKRARLCAAILLFVNLSLSGAILMIIYHGRGFEYYGILIYVMAMYTFYITVVAIVNMVKYKKYHSPIMSTAKSIDLAAALFSMLSLETAMLSQFGTDSSPEAKKIMIIATGAAISVVIFCVSIYTIAKNSREIKQHEQDL